MESKLFPFDEPLYKDYVFYVFLILTYREMSEGLRALVEYGYGNLVLQLLEVVSEAVLVSWVFAILLASARRFFRNRSARRLEETKVQSHFPGPEVTITKLSKPVAELTPEERRQAAEKIAEDFLKEQGK
jgi:hypothetical protein